ncbi:hypothetical protein IU479_14710 [Nocardia abscessus]|jgi:hypothetical protein|uniref:hypothetical protein n=1 Tax=Nocardia TaxID=1817 RepID=UPI0015EFA00B|nr:MULTISPECIES: hypothetical protein [Nocardia]MBF6219363.1 hypothetical protein [Nocardia abscessus]MBF6338522.1 hypothetical protein [Nocardia abscessus]MBF6471766.1 hypothetical protein [Nocardia abscessus]MDE1669257.1 hypothetical protein [Nocardia gipuzkoensis]
MTIRDKIAHQVRAGRSSLRTLLAKTDEDSRRRTDVGGRRPGGTIALAGRKLKQAFTR